MKNRHYEIAIRVIAALVVIGILMATGCVIVKRFAQSASDKPDNENTVVVPVSWQGIASQAKFEETRFSAGKLSLERVNFVSAFPIEDQSYAWNFHKLKVLFRGAGMFDGTKVKATIEAVVEMKVEPHQCLRFQVSHIDNVAMSIFDTAGKNILADMSDAAAAFSQRVAALSFDFDGHMGVAKDNITGEKAAFHNDRIEFNVRNMK